MISAAEFLKWCEVFGVTFNGGGGGSFLPLAGGTMAGTIDMDNNLISNAQVEYKYTELSGDADLGVTNSNEIFIYLDASIDLADELGLASFTNGFTFALKNLSNGDVTFTPKSGDLIDGQSVLTLAPQDGYIIVKNATQWSIIGTNVGGGGGVTSTQVQQASFNVGVDSGVADAYIVTLNPTPVLADSDCMTISFTPLNSNATPTPTVDIGDGSGVIQINGVNNSTLDPGSILAGFPCDIQWSVTEGTWYLLNNQAIVTALSVQNQIPTYGVDTGTANSYIIPTFVQSGSYEDGMVVQFTALNSNSGSSGIQVGGLAEVSLLTNDGNDLLANMVLAGGIYQAQYSGNSGNFILLNPSVPLGGTVTPAEIQNQNYTYFPDTGSAGAYVVTMVPTPDFVAGLRVNMQSFQTSMNGSTLNVNGNGDIPIITTDGFPITFNAISDGALYDLEYDGANFELLNPSVTPFSLSANVYGYGIDTGAADAYIVNIQYAPISQGYTDGQLVEFVATNSNTTASTINVNANGIVPILTQGNTPLTANQIILNNNYNLIYNGSLEAFVLLNPDNYYYLPLLGGTMLGAINMGGFGINSMLDPVNPQDAVTLNYLDTFYLPLIGGTLSGTLNMGSNYIQNLLDPVNAQDAATKNYADMIAAGFIVQPAVVAASTADLNATYFNGISNDGVGATLTNLGSLAAFTLDGYSPQVNDLVLAKDQTDPTQNGIYSVTVVGNGSTAWVLTRATFYNTAADINPGDFILINSGDTQAGEAWLETATIGAVGTDPILFSLFGSGIYALKGANADITSMSALTGFLGAPSGILDANGNAVVAFGATLNSVNYFAILNNISGAPPVLVGSGSDINVGLGFQCKGSEAYHFFGNSSVPANIRLYEVDTNGSSSIGLACPPSIVGDLTYYLPGLDGVANAPLETDGSGNLSFGGVFTDITGSVSITGFSGSPTKVVQQLIIGKLVCLSINITGTSNATTFTITGLPKTSAAHNQVGINAVTDSGTQVSGAWGISSSSTTINFYKSAGAAAFTSSGTKGTIVNLWYQAT